MEANCVLSQVEVMDAEKRNPLPDDLQLVR